MVSDWLVVVQAVAAAVSAATAAYLVWVTLRRDGDARRERERDLADEQIRRLVGGLRSLHGVLDTDDELEFEVARSEIAVALGLRPTLIFQASEALLGDDMLKPPYALGQMEPWNRLEAALEEVREYALASWTER